MLGHSPIRASVSSPHPAASFWNLCSQRLPLLLQVLWRKGYGKECDVWSLGIVLFIALAGYPPFDGANNDEVNIPSPTPPLYPPHPLGILSLSCADLTGAVV